MSKFFEIFTKEVAKHPKPVRVEFMDTDLTTDNVRLSIAGKEFANFILSPDLPEIVMITLDYGKFKLDIDESVRIAKMIIMGKPEGSSVVHET